MKDFAKSIVCNTKVGNGITKFGLGKYVIADGYKAVVLGETEERGPNGIPFGWVTIRWVEGPWKGQSDQQYDYDLKKAGNTKTGNIKDDAKAKELHKKMMDAKEIAEEWGRASYSQKKDNLEGGRNAAEDAYRKAKKEYEDYAMNKKTGNESLGEYMAKKPRVINEEKTGAEEFFKKLAKDGEKRAEKDDAEIEKVGNLSKDELLKELDVEEKLLKVLEERGGEKGYGTTPILYRDAKRRIQDIKNKLKQIGNKVGNAKDKNDRDMKIGDMVDVHGKKGKIQKIITAQDSRDDVIEVFFDNSGTYNPDRTDRFYANEVVKVGNSAPDDKFAYVMREFDAGKLKTPDGKVVTDPAQAKAIAYSESKKTENGLARARNAIKKS